MTALLSSRIPSSIMAATGFLILLLLPMTISNNNGLVTALVFSDFVTSVVPKSIFGHTRPIANFDTLIQAQIQSKLNVRLDIHNINEDNNDKFIKKSNNEPVVGMSINGVEFELLSTKVSKNNKMKSNKKNNNIVMPGAHGPHPAVSSGIHHMDTLQTGKFVDITGTVQLPLDKMSACWELIWRENAMAGYLICAMYNNKSISRFNNKLATIPEGPIYITFPVWKRDMLNDYQQRKKEVLDRASELIFERDLAIQKMQETSNVFQKAMYYRNAASAVEKYSLYPVQSMTKHVPDSNDVVPITNNNNDSDLFITKIGTVWTKKASSTTASSLINPLLGNPTKQQQLLGTATIVRYEKNGEASSSEPSSSSIRLP